MCSERTVPYACSLTPAATTAGSLGEPILAPDRWHLSAPNRQLASLGPISLLRRKPVSDPDLTPSIKHKVFSFLIAENWQEKTAAHQSGFRKASFTQLDDTDQSHKNVHTPPSMTSPPGLLRGPRSYCPERSVPRPHVTGRSEPSPENGNVNHYRAAGATSQRRGSPRRGGNDTKSTQSLVKFHLRERQLCTLL